MCSDFLASQRYIGVSCKSTKPKVKQSQQGWKWVTGDREDSQTLLDLEPFIVNKYYADACVFWTLVGMQISGTFLQYPRVTNLRLDRFSESSSFSPNKQMLVQHYENTLSSHFCQLFPTGVKSRYFGNVLTLPD